MKVNSCLICVLLRENRDCPGYTKICLDSYLDKLLSLSFEYVISLAITLSRKRTANALISLRQMRRLISAFAVRIDI